MKAKVISRPLDPLGLFSVSVLVAASVRHLLALSCSTKQAFPRLHEAATVTVSVVIPAYNEEERIKVMLDEMLDFLEKHASRTK